MKLEIEAKIKVTKLEPLAEKLRQLGAEFLQTVREQDLYFNSADGLLKKSDRGLRLRKRTSQVLNSKSEIFLTYKGPRGKSVFKSREEIQVRVDDFDAMKNILLGLGYKEHLTVDKIRQIWQLEQCEICLDDVMHLGTFIEVEGPDEKTIAGILEKLGLDKTEHISKGYAKMTAENLKSRTK
jgi:predicted adenylyl cyclase CyaB